MPPERPRDQREAGIFPQDTETGRIAAAHFAVPAERSCARRAGL